MARPRSGTRKSSESDKGARFRHCSSSPPSRSSWGRRKRPLERQSRWPLHTFFVCWRGVRRRHGSPRENL
eukprot:7603678-Alexandrium_andersonii.AAC.1